MYTLLCLRVWCLKVGNLASGQTVFIKFAGDGLEIAKRDVATAHTITVSNEEKALQIATISLMHAREKYQVPNHFSDLLSPLLLDLLFVHISPPHSLPSFLCSSTVNCQISIITVKSFITTNSDSSQHRWRVGGGILHVC